MKVDKIKSKFVTNIPEVLEDGILYISLKYNIIIHKCPCGCSEEVVTPIGYSGWNLDCNDKGVSLDPSIGNWQFKCKSHYWIKNNEIVWC